MTTLQRLGPQFTLYLPRILLDWQAQDPGATQTTRDGTLLLVDLSGFTSMSERLAAKGKLGAEEVHEVLNTRFTKLLRLALTEGGDPLKFAGDSLLLLFMGPEHVNRAARAACLMRGTIDETEGESTNLATSAGISGGPIEFFLAGESHRELVVTGETASRVVRQQARAEAGQSDHHAAWSPLPPS